MEEIQIEELINISSIVDKLEIKSSRLKHKIENGILNRIPKIKDRRMKKLGGILEKKELLSTVDFHLKETVNIISETKSILKDNLDITYITSQEGILKVKEDVLKVKCEDEVLDRRRYLENAVDTNLESADMVT